jgi:surface protein
MDITKKVTKITYNGVNLPLNGGTPEPLNPVYVYKTQRNPEWLNMLGTGYGENYDEMETYYNTADNEIRLLFHLTPPADNLIAFICTTSSEQYNVSYYDKDDNLISVDVNSGATFEANLMYDDFKHEMLDGTRQVLIVIKPTTIGSDLLTFTPATNSLKTSPSNYMNWTVVEMMGKATSGTSITPSGSGSLNQQFGNLEFYTLFGTNLITYMDYMFGNCSSLIAIPQLDTSFVANMNFMFSGCRSLTAIPELNTSSSTSMNSMFRNCSSLIAIPQLDTSFVANMNFMFSGCSSLIAIPQLDTSSVGDISFIFMSCSSLTTIPQLDTSSATNMSNIFNGTQTLKTLTITATDWAGVSFSIADCSLGYQALLNLLDSLPPVTSNPTLTATNNIGTAQLSAEVLAETPPAEYTQAVSRGWTIIL